MKQHYFWAVSIPEPIKEKIAQYCEQMQLPFKRWVHPQDYHITLAFLGDASDEMLDVSRANVESAVADINAFSLTIEGFGTFGNSESPRIFWAGLHKSESLHALREKIYQACEHAGFQLETRPFSPHVTVARKWEGISSFSDRPLMPQHSFSFQAAEVVLYKTNLEQTPKYEKTAIIRLKGE